MLTSLLAIDPVTGVDDADVWIIYAFAIGVLAMVLLASAKVNPFKLFRKKKDDDNTE